MIEHRAMTVHAPTFWVDTVPPQKITAHRVKAAMEEYENGVARNAYVDVHNYQFTPDSISRLVMLLNELNLINLSVHRVYPTKKGQVEFGLVLKNNKCKNE